MPLPKNEHLGHFLMLDIGHPMTSRSINLIKLSLMNILSLASCIPGTARIPVFGFGLQHSYFKVVHQWDFLAGNLSVIASNLESINTDESIGVKISLREYKILLEKSIQNIISNFFVNRNDWMFDTQVKHKFDAHRYWPAQIQITLITKKAASPIVDMLTANSELGSIRELKKVEIVEILFDRDFKPRFPKKYIKSISCTIISENSRDLEAVFKKWIAEYESDREHIQIILDERLKVHIKCELEDCALNPENLPIYQHFSLPSNFPRVVPQRPLVLPDFQTRELAIISKIEITDLCPSLLFGLPQRVYPRFEKRSKRNEKLFRELCFELFQREIGLLARLQRSSHNVAPLYFIVSDGKILLLNNIIPTELRLPRRSGPTQQDEDDTDNNDNEANCIICSSLDRIKITTDCSTEEFAAGIYNALSQHLKNESKKIASPHSNLKSKSNSKPAKMTSKLKTYNNINPGEYTPRFLTEINEDKQILTKSKSGNKRKPADDGHTHPALLSPGTVAKYRKPGYQRYQLPELNEPGII